MGKGTPEGGHGGFPFCVVRSTESLDSFVGRPHSGSICLSSFLLVPYDMGCGLSSYLYDHFPSPQGHSNLFFEENVIRMKFFQANNGMLPVVPYLFDLQDGRPYRLTGRTV